MKRQGVTLQTIADACGVGVSTVGAWTQAKNWPQTELQPVLAHFLQSSVNFLFHGITEGAEIPQAMEVTAIAGVTEESRVYDAGSNDQRAAREIIREIELHNTMLLASAGHDIGRLGWIREQQVAHLSTPAHWKKPEKIPQRPVEKKIPLTKLAQTQLLSATTGKPHPPGFRPGALPAAQTG